MKITRSNKMVADVKLNFVLFSMTKFGLWKTDS